VEEKTKTITFLLSWWDKPLSFTQDEFIYSIGLSICKDAVPVPPKETVLDQNTKEEVKDTEFVAMEEVAEDQSLEIPTVEQLLDEADNKLLQTF
nr:hypothetical protein [Tanacetum cinerariifolium]